ncbi:MAG: hypothetical protein KF724_07390 [Phycisphaeraceae bacterium]|nr:hypothetical protein [Phycisphaeraceae bacterium]
MAALASFQFATAQFAPSIPGAGAPAAPGAAPTARDVVRVTHAGTWRNADGNAVIGVRFTMAEKWHIYWANPGESGLPTTLHATLPAGWSARQVIFPRPDTFSSDDETTFGYEDSAVLLLTVHAEEDAGGGAATVTARYLVCRGICLSGDGEISLSLPDRAAVANLPLLPGVVEGRSLPRPLSELDATIRIDGSIMTISAPKLPTLESEGQAKGTAGDPAAPKPDDPNAPEAPAMSPRQATEIRFLPFDLPGFRLPDGLVTRGVARDGGFRIALRVTLDSNDAPGQVLAAGGLVTVGPGRQDPCFEFSVEAADTPREP